jgi:hypothetical protein
MLYYIKKLIIIPISLISLAVTGTNYYVKNTGNDSNTGLSDEQAWAHHPWMSTWTGTVTLRPGDIVNMKKGDVWVITTPSAPYMTVNQSGSAGSPITTTWYGVSVNKPLIKIAGDYNYPVIQGLGKSFITFDHLEISHYTSTRKNSGQSGIVFGKDYNDSNITPHDWIITNCDIHNIPMIGIQSYDDSYNIIIGDTSATTCATSSSYSNNIYDCGYGGIVLCGRDPVSDHSYWDVIYNYIHEIDYSGGLVRDAYGIAFDAGETGTGRGNSDGWPSYCVAKFNRVEDVPGHTGIDTHGGTNIYFQDNYVYNCLMGIVTQAADRVGHKTTILSNVYVERNTIKNPSTNTLGYRCFILMVGENVLHRPTNCYLRDNILAYDSRPASEIGAIGIEIYSVDGITIEGNKIYNGPIGPVGQSDAGIHIGETNRNVKNITICKNWIFNWDHGIYTCSGAVDGDIAFYYNIINSHGRAFMAYDGAFSGNFKVLNNTFLASANATYPYVIDFSGSEISTGASLSIKNNIAGYTKVASSGYYILTPGTINGSITIDYNLYWNSAKSNPFYLKNVSYAWPDWNNYGYDVHSFNNTDPLFKNTSGSYSKDLDFVLQSISPAINKGTDVGLNTDYSGNPVSGLPDIGAFEYGASNPDFKPVITVTVSGIGGVTSITTDNGTLQLSANVLPANATNKTVTWSITSGSDKASISSTGLVSALDNGTTVARATANDGSGVYGTLIITITNQITIANSPPVIVVNYNSSSYSGFVNELSASGSYDADKDNLTFTWSAPASVPISSTSGATIKFLGPIVNEPTTVEFTVSASDGKTTQSKVIPVEILPYKPELDVAEVSGIEASSYLSPNYPNNIVDGNIGTMWVAEGTDQWLVLELTEPFSIQNVKLAFQPGQRRESYFDVLGSADKNAWEPVLIKSASCDFSGDLQVFDFPASKAEKEFRYVKLAAQGNSTDSWNFISEMKIYGYKHKNPSFYENLAVKLYPNPAKEIINIKIDEPGLSPDFIRIINLAGYKVFQEKINPDTKEFQIPLNLKNGVYIVQMGSGSLTLYASKLIVFSK